MSLLHMSFAGAVMILAVIVIRALAINLLPKKTFLVLWGIVAIRLLLPFSIPSAFSVYSLIGNHIPTTAPAKVPQAFEMLPVETNGQMFIMPSGISNMASPISVWAIIWCFGVLVCALVFAIAYWKCRQEFQTSLPVDNDFIKGWLRSHRLKRAISVRQSSRFSAPLTYGVFRPVILVPTSTDWENTKSLKYVLTHEYVHIRRFDSITKLVLVAALCVHWFNPLVWAMYILANRDIELSCDEAVVRLFGESTKAAYARSLISMEETRSGLTPLCNNFNKNAIEERITAIMKIKKVSVFSLVLAVALIVGVTTAFATSAQAAAENTEHTIAIKDDHVFEEFVSLGTTGSENVLTKSDGVLFSVNTSSNKEEEQIDNAVTPNTQKSDATFLETDRRELSEDGDALMSLAPEAELLIGTVTVGEGKKITVSITSAYSADIEVCVKSVDKGTTNSENITLGAEGGSDTVAIQIGGSGEYILSLKNNSSINADFSLSYIIR